MPQLSPTAHPLKGFLSHKHNASSISIIQIERLDYTMVNPEGTNFDHPSGTSYKM